MPANTSEHVRKDQALNIILIAAEKKGRLFSLNALWSFDMLMISGANNFLVLLEDKTDCSQVDRMAKQIHHP